MGLTDADAIIFVAALWAFCIVSERIPGPALVPRYDPGWLVAGRWPVRMQKRLGRASLPDCLCQSLIICGEPLNVADMKRYCASPFSPVSGLASSSAFFPAPALSKSSSFCCHSAAFSGFSNAS